MGKVCLEQVACAYDQTTIVSEISFEIPDGQFWVLVGPSGCGKSTILRMIAGLETPTTGNILIGDSLVNQIPARQRDVAMVFQNYALYPHMTVAENLAFGLKMRQVEAGKIQERILSVAKSLDIAHLLPRKPKQLSGGQQQRVALGRAIARNPQVFLLDEPLSNLDAQLRDETRAELKQLHQQIGITTIYVTHDQTEAMTLADQIVVLDQGKIQQIGSPQQIYHHPHNRMVASFLGSPPMNLLHGLFMDDHLTLANDQQIPCSPRLVKTLQRLASQHVELGIRPEHFYFPDQSPYPSPEGQSNLETNQETNLGQLQIEITLVEPLGRENLIRARLIGDDSQSLNLITAGQVTPRLGERLTVNFNLNNLNIFNPNTGECLGNI
jgi:multiple sugar transport system ATP-binding protein